jgi:hypothetical protein
MSALQKLQCSRHKSAVSQRHLLFDPVFAFSVQLNFLLLEVSALLLVDQNQVQIVSHTELVIDILIGWREVIR